MKYPQIYAIAKALANIDPEDWLKFEATFKELTFQKHEIIAKPGAEADTIYFLLSGVTRNYFIHETGREYTKTFRGAGGLVGPYSEILAKTKTKYFIQATVESKVVQFSYKVFENFMKNSHAWERLGRAFAEMNYLEKEKREYMLMHMDISQKYAEFLEDFKPVKDHIPQYQVASYLGVSPEALNRYLTKKTS